ncbi:MG2 domain-containing protein [Phycisphaeraceae bacterium D3-23]
MSITRTSLYAALLASLGMLVPALAQDRPLPPGVPETIPEPAEAEPEPTPQQQLTDALGGEARYLTHLSTDKPIYRAGETVYVRGVVLNAFDHSPLPEDENNQANPMVEIKDPKGAVVASGQSRMQDSTIGFSWEVPEGQPGGEYTIKVTYPWSGHAPTERTFDIRAYRPPRIKTQIEFLRDGYGPGDTVVATLEAERAEGGVPEGATVTAIARVDGVEVARVPVTMSNAGNAEARFELPAEIERGEGSLAFVIEDGGVVETASKTIPILLQTVDLQFYPEGGDLVAGVENRVYFEARTPVGKPADLRGVLTKRVILEADGDAHGWEVIREVSFETTHEGRGSFRFTPEIGEQYAVLINEPSSISQVFDLPGSIDAGLTFGFERSVFDFDDAIAFMPATHGLQTEVDNGESAIRLVLSQREQELAAFIVSPLILDRTEVTFLPESQAKGDDDFLVITFPDTATGILTVTAYDAEGSPLAERLIYRAPRDRVNIEIVPNSAQYTPSGEVQLTIRTTDADGNPIPAMAGVTVTDDSTLEMIETREQRPTLPAMVLLEQEVRELMDAAVYLDPDNADAAQQLDLLLGTQGWRRFALVDVAEFLREHGDTGRRALAIRAETRREQLRAARNEVRRRGGGPVDEEALERFADAIEEADGAVDDAAPLLDNAVPLPMAANAPGADPAAQAGPAEGADDDANQGPPPPPPVNADEVREALEAQDDAGDALFAEEDLAQGARARQPMPQMIFVREYAHDQPAGKPFGERSDFTETVYWSAATKTGDDGLATITFDLSDSVTSFRVSADAFNASGALGANSELIESVRPFYVEPKLPLELTAGDTVLLPIAMVNNTDRDLPVELLVSRLGQAGTLNLDPILLGADQRERSLYELAIGETYGDLAFNIEARAGGMFDENRRRLRVVPRGFPVDSGSGGMLQPDGEAGDRVVVPDTVVPGSLHASVTVYPTPLANLTEALEALIRDPYGCFEQTSSSTFPLVMAQQYFLSHQGVDPALVAAAQEKLDAGYQRLIGFETEQNGYEWFGSTPPHEALTAYGLLEFVEMSKVMDVDQDMIDRTQEWLLGRCGNDGSFELDEKALDSFGRAPQDTTDAYIVWALLEAGMRPARIEASIERVLTLAQEGEDAYIIALAANIAQIAAQHYVGDAMLSSDTDTIQKLEAIAEYHRDVATQLMTKLSTKLDNAGYVDGAVTSITRSGGNALKIEATSLAILAWLKDDNFAGEVEKSILWLTERCKAGAFGSTQSTVLALKAIVAYDAARAVPKAPGELTLVVDGEVVGEPLAFDEETKGALRLPDIAALLTPGEHTVAVQMSGGSKMPYSIAIEFFAETPASSDECALRIETRLNAEQEEQGVGVVGEGEATEVVATITNTTAEGLPTPLAIVGIPGGLEPRYVQLKELVEQGTIASFEVIGRDVVLYWREMQPEQVVEVSISCIAAVPGTYTGPASRAYLYYTNEHKQWADGLTVQITPRQGGAE